MKPKKANISLWRLSLAVLVVAGAATAAWLFQPRYNENIDALASSLVSIFSVLAGFLAAIIAVVANDRSLKGRTWRHDTFYLEKVRKELGKHQLLFYFYLAALVLAFVSQLKYEWPCHIQVWLERALLFVAALAISMSFALPARLTKRQIEDLEKVINDRADRETGNKSRKH